MSDLVDEAQNMEDNHLRTGDLDQATLYGNLATEIERLEHENKAWRTKDNKSERLIHELMQQRDALKGQIEAYKKDVFRDLGRDEETGLILFRTWKDQAHIYKEQRDELAAALSDSREGGDA
eukprot:GHVU01183202.1.p2 GENE.GHVU01183202.1~~GHVU01183202.1.p2  ORF type:complete len:122 (-),score=15.41 GHVU01183202.1:525-890(-)